MSTKKQREIRVFQDNAYLSLDFMNQAGPPREEERHHRLRPEAEGRPRQGRRRLVHPVHEIPIEKGEPLAIELAHFVESVREAKQPKVGAALGKSALEVAIAITEQIRKAQK
jgi:predicted dehydrogenase